MPKFSANLSMLFTELPFLNRFDAAARAGFKAVEYVSPYEVPEDQVANQLKRNGLTQALFNLPAGNWAGGEKGITCLPDRVDEFRSGVATAIRYAKATDCTMLNALAGIKPATVPREVAMSTMIANTAFAAAELAKEGILLVVEPINHFDIPGYLLNRSSDGLEVMDAVGSDNLKLQYDLYHMQRMEGEIAATLDRLLPRIGHIQIADNPGRNEPGTGEMNYRFLLRHLDRIGYQGWVGCEYKPKTTTVEGLGWMSEFI